MAAPASRRPRRRVTASRTSVRVVRPPALRTAATTRSDPVWGPPLRLVCAAVVSRGCIALTFLRSLGAGRGFAVVGHEGGEDRVALGAAGRRVAAFEEADVAGRAARAAC